jgi:Kef-type K+ transport system membrane component KefB
VSLQQTLIELAIVSLIAALAPIVSGLLARRVPQVVIFILGGILIGPQVLGWADPESLQLVSNLGLGFLFLLAGYELELGLFRERAGRLAIKAEIGLGTGVMLPENAAALVGAGVLSVIVFPAIAVGLARSGAQPLVPTPERDGRQ